MGEVSLNIHGKDYGISCDDGQEDRVIEVGRYVDSRAHDIAQAGAASNENHLLVLTALVLADEIKDMRDNLGRLQQQRTANPENGQQTTGISDEEEQAIVQSIEQLAERIDNVAERLQKTA